MEKAFRGTFSSDQCSQVLYLRTKYRSLFSLVPSELGKSTITEADFPLQPGTTPVDRNPYRANPRVQEVIDMCVNQMEKDPLKKMESSNNDRVNGARQSICCVESYTTTHLASLACVVSCWRLVSLSVHPQPFRPCLICLPKTRSGSPLRSSIPVPVMLRAV